MQEDQGRNRPEPRLPLRSFSSSPQLLFLDTATIPTYSMRQSARVHSEYLKVLYQMTTWTVLPDPLLQTFV